MPIDRNVTTLPTGYNTNESHATGLAYRHIQKLSKKAKQQEYIPLSIKSELPKQNYTDVYEAFASEIRLTKKKKKKKNTYHKPSNVCGIVNSYAFRRDFSEE